MTKRSRLPQSSAHGLLKGARFGTKTIAGVYRGPGTTRVLRFVGGGQKKVHRAEIHELAKLTGLLQYQTKFSAASRAGKRVMLKRSEARQAAILRNYKKRLTGELAHIPESARAQMVAHLARIEHQSFGSPLVGKTPASVLIAARPGRTFGTAQKAGVRFVTVRRGGKTRVIPMRG